MPRIFDNIEQKLLPALQETLAVSQRADFCAGYFNLRGWKLIESGVDKWTGGTNGSCRLLVGMQKLPHDELKETLSLLAAPESVDNQAAIRVKRKIAEEFRQQLAMGAPTNDDEAGLRGLAAQIRAKKVVVKLFLRHQLHAKLYLLHRKDPINPIIGFVGSSNLTFSGLSGQGELNVDVLDGDAAKKLAAWFEDRWNDKLCLDISEDLVKIIEESWARETLISPYHVYIKMAYHLSQEARAGVSEFRIPKDFGNRLFEFQAKAVKIAAHHLNKRGGVLIGDVVGLGKTLMATALARIFEDDYGLETLILCPKNLVSLWEDYRDRYRLRARIISISRVMQELPTLRRYRLVLIDESHHLRNREGKRYRAIADYVKENDSKVILLSATPYNKSYVDLSNQLRLFVPEDEDLGVRPEKMLREMTVTEFSSKFQCGPKTIAAFEKSIHPDDWRELMRLFLVRRTRSFIQAHYALTDSTNGRKYLLLEDGSKSYFPERVPRTLKFALKEKGKENQYARLYSDPVVDTINKLMLPRYGLGNYLAASPAKPATTPEAKQLADLSRAGQRLMGFCRTNLFKRLESSGAAFLLSLERHILRNYVFLHAIEKGLPLPLGAQDSDLLDGRLTDEDPDLPFDGSDDDEMSGAAPKASPADDDLDALKTAADFKKKAAAIYATYATTMKSRFKWLRSDLFSPKLKKHLGEDCTALTGVMASNGVWEPDRDAKLDALWKLLTSTHPADKVLVFSQFADTVRYLEAELTKRGLKQMAAVTGGTEQPTEIAWQFSPVSNGKRDDIPAQQELRVLISTDILSEGQNLQDCHVVVNFDLPWAIIRLIQRAGRVDRIGQRSPEILCYSFLPAEGVERLIQLRACVRQRLRENADVVGTDEAFFEGEDSEKAVVDLYNEHSSVLEGEDDGEVDLASYAYQIWKEATDGNPALQKQISELPDVQFATRNHKNTEKQPEGVLVYVKTAEDNDALAYVDTYGRSITESQFEILKLARCSPTETARERHAKHHGLVRDAVNHIVREEARVGGQLGRPGSARFRTFTRLKPFAEKDKGTLFERKDLLKALDEIYRFPLKQSAADTLNRQLKAGIEPAELAELVLALREEDRLCVVEGEGCGKEPRILCSLGMFVEGNNG